MAVFSLGITHPGAAHLDDFLCAAILAAQGVRRFERRQPTDAELDDPQVVVFDTGMQYDPALSNYDHHQFPRDAEAENALSLLSKELEWGGVRISDLLETTQWFRASVILDAKGPFALAKELNTTPEVVFSLFSPVEETLIAEFGARDVIEEGDFLMDVLRSVGTRLLDDLLTTWNRLESLDREAEIVEVSGVSGYVLDDPDTTGTQTWRRVRHPHLAFAVSRSDRDGEGWALYRYDDDERIDFSRLNGREEVVFAHVGGFIAKTREGVTRDEALRLVRDAIVVNV